jgi:hypothetical protein
MRNVTQKSVGLARRWTISGRGLCSLVTMGRDRSTLGFQCDDREVKEVEERTIVRADNAQVGFCEMASRNCCCSVDAGWEQRPSRRSADEAKAFGGGRLQKPR